MEEETEADADTEEGIDRKDETEEAEEIEETKPFNSQSNVEKKILCTETAAKLNSKLEMPSWGRRGHFSYVIRSPKKNWKLKWIKVQNYQNDRKSWNPSRSSCPTSETDQERSAISKSKSFFKPFHSAPSRSLTSSRASWPQTLSPSPSPRSYLPSEEVWESCGESSGPFNSFNSHKSGSDQIQVPLSHPTLKALKARDTHSRWKVTQS